MKVQENPTNGQKFINLPAKLCQALDIEQGDEIEFKIVDKKSITMNIL